MNDPISSLQAPPPRYLLESDSSDEEGQGEYAASSSRRSARAVPSPEVSLEWSDAQCQRGIKDVVLGLGQVGRYMIRKTGGGEGKRYAVGVIAGEAEVGRGWVMGDSLLIELDELEGEDAWRVAGKLVEGMQGVKWTLLTTYVPAMYIPDPEAAPSPTTDAPIRSLSATKSTLPWNSPNYLTGVAGAFASLAAHPASPLTQDTLSVLVLPLPLSSINPAALVSSLTNTAPSLSATLAEKQENGSRTTKWDETDDEPFSAVGMGGGKKSVDRNGAVGLGKEEISSMYM